MHDGALDYPLESKRWLSINLFGSGNHRRIVINKIFQLGAQLSDIDRTGLQNLDRGGVIQ